MGAPTVGAQNAQARSHRRAHLLSPTQMGRRLQLTGRGYHGGGQRLARTRAPTLLGITVAQVALQCGPLEKRLRTKRNAGGCCADVRLGYGLGKKTSMGARRY